jgi:hypothetical protein
VFDLRKNTGNTKTRRHEGEKNTEYKMPPQPARRLCIEYKMSPQPARRPCIEYKMPPQPEGSVCIGYKVVAQPARSACIGYKIVLQPAGRLCIEYKMAPQSARSACIGYKVVAQPAGIPPTLYGYTAHSILANLISTLFSKQNNLSSQRAIPPLPATLLTLFSPRFKIKKLIRLIRFGKAEVPYWLLRLFC